jgi:bifunctional DNA-binding transcriptional regulator/antitoxin component of YhaV-PrlF toxin-antitoxin module
MAITIQPTAARVRPKNQITVPDAALASVGVSVGDRLLVTVEDGVIKLEPIRTSYFGALKGVWGPNWMEELRAERDRDWR